MAVVYLRTGIIKPGEYDAAMKGMEEALGRWGEATDSKSALYHRIGGDVGRVMSMAVFDDMAAAGQIMNTFYADDSNRKLAVEIGSHFLPESRKNSIWLRHGG